MTARMVMPAGMTAPDHDRIADSYFTEAAALQLIVNRLTARAVAHRETAASLRDTYQTIRDHNNRERSDRR